METSEKNNTSAFNLWEYLYYRATKLFGNIEKKFSYKSHRFKGSLVVAMCINLNLFFIVMMILNWFNLPLLKNIDSKYLAFICYSEFFIVFALIYQYFVKKRHDIIFEHYEKETLAQKSKRGWIVFFYLSISLLVMIVIATLGEQHKL